MGVIKVGIVGLQGDVFEHIEALERAFIDLSVEGNAIWARRPADLSDADGVILPGGESTTISKLLTKFGLKDIVKQMARDGSPVLGTCAGCVLLASEGDQQVRKTKTELLSLMDMAVNRNAFGPQRESFERMLDINGLGKYPGVFIRAPLITRTWGDCRTLSRIEEGIVLAKQDNLIAASFHPELTGDSSFYRLFLDLF